MHIAFVESNTVGLAALAAAKKAGHRVTFVASGAFAEFIGGIDTARKVGLCDRIIEINSSLNEDELYETLLAVQQSESLDAVVTVLDFCTHVVARCARRLGLPCTDPAAVSLAQDKAACRGRLASEGIRSVRYALVEDVTSAKREAQSLGYPVMAKPKRGAASLNAAKITDSSGFDRYFAQLSRDLHVPPGVVRTLSPETLIEEYVTGPLFSIEIAAAGGDYRAMAVSWRKRCIEDPSVELGTVIPAPVSQATASSLSEYALEVVRTLGLDLGIFHVEVIHGPEGPVLVEVNPRIMGGNIPTVFRLATDVDPFALLVEIHLHGRLPQAARDVRPVRAAATRSIGPAEPGTPPATLRDDWTQPFRGRITNWNVKLVPSAAVPAMESTYCPNHFQLVGNSSLEASLLAEWVIAVAGRATGLQLRQSGEDYHGL